MNEFLYFILLQLKCLQTECAASKYNKFPVDTILRLTVLITTCANWYTCQSVNKILAPLPGNFFLLRLCIDRY